VHSEGLTAWVECDRLWGLDAQKRLRSAKVCLLGMTGLGCEVIVTQDCGSAFILWRSGTGSMWRSHSGLRIRFHYMEIRNWGYVAQSPRIVDPLSFYGDRNWGQCCGYALVSMRIWIQLFISIRIWIQGAKPMRIHADPDPDPSQALKSQKV
jgi:hypothetical protein